jgi:hypothetical protein
MNIFSTIATALGAPDPAVVQADATQAATQLQTAFAVLIGEGAIAVGLLVLIAVMTWKKRGA